MSDDLVSQQENANKQLVDMCYFTKDLLLSEDVSLVFFNRFVGTL